MAPDPDLEPEPRRPAPDAGVPAWVAGKRAIRRTAIRKPVLPLSAGPMPMRGQVHAMGGAVAALRAADVMGRILPLERAAAQGPALLRANRRAEGRPIAAFGAAVAMRNLRAFHRGGVRPASPGARG